MNKEQHAWEATQMQNNHTGLYPPKRTIAETKAKRDADGSLLVQTYHFFHKGNTY